MDAYDYYGVTYMPFTPHTGGGGSGSYQQQQQQSGSYNPYQYGSQYGYGNDGSSLSSMAMFAQQPFTQEFIWGMTFGTTVLMLVICLALWCCLPAGLASAACCYIRKYQRQPEKRVNGVVTIA